MHPVAATGFFSSPPTHTPVPPASRAPLELWPLSCCWRKFDASVHTCATCHYSRAAGFQGQSTPKRDDGLPPPFRVTQSHPDLPKDLLVPSRVMESVVQTVLILPLRSLLSTELRHSLRLTSWSPPIPLPSQWGVGEPSTDIFKSHFRLRSDIPTDLKHTHAHTQTRAHTRAHMIL